MPIPQSCYWLMKRSPKPLSRPIGHLMPPAALAALVAETDAERIAAAIMGAVPPALVEVVAAAVARGLAEQQRQHRQALH